MRNPSLYLGLSSLLAACGGAAPGPHPAQPPSAQTVKAAGDLREAVGRLTSRAGGQQVTEAPGGVRIFKVEQGFGQVVVAKANPDGTVSTKCVESADDAFLNAESAK